MTLLVGQNNNTAFTAGVELANNSRVDWGLFTAVASGTATTINLWMTPQGGAEAFRLGVWNGSAGAPTGGQTYPNLVLSAELTPSTGADSWVSASISLSITLGVQYCLGVFGSNNAATNPIFFYSDGTGTGTYEDDSSGGGYPTAPTLSAAGIEGQIGNIAIYLDGTTGGSSTASIAWVG